MKQITANIYQISLSIVNVFVIEGNGLTLIDTGPAGSADKIFAELKKAGKNPYNINRIILTHLHSDHTGSAAELKRKLKVPLLAHPADATLIEKGLSSRSGNGDQPMQLSPGAINWLIYHTFIKRAPKTIEPVKIDELINENDLIPVAGGLRIIHTPGHSAGHISVLAKNEGVLIAADSCANSAGLGLSILYEDRESGIQSIRKAASHDFEKAGFGHGKLIMKDAAKQMRQVFGRI